MFLAAGLKGSVWAAGCSQVAARQPAAIIDGNDY